MIYYCFVYEDVKKFKMKNVVYKMSFLYKNIKYYLNLFLFMLKSIFNGFKVIK